MPPPNAEALRRADEAIERGDVEGSFSNNAADVVVHSQKAAAWPATTGELDQLHNRVPFLRRQGIGDVVFCP